jgi:drug/metabolite transporter (DMT)-like permease
VTAHGAAGAEPGAALFTIPAMLGFAANSLLCRAALGARLADPGSFTGLRLLSGAVVLAAIVALRRRGRPRGGSWGSAAALFAYAAAFSLAYVRIPAGVGAVLLFTAVQVSMLAWALRGGDRLAARQWVGVALALGGLAAMNLPGARAPDPAGAALMVAAGVAWAVYSIRGRSAKDPLSTTADNFVRGVPFAALFALVPGDAGLAPAGAGLAVASGALASGLGYALWYAALPLLGVTRGAVVQLAVPAIAALGGVVLLDERPTARVAAAGVAILAGVALATLRPRRAQPRNRSSSAATSSGASSAR